MTESRSHQSVLRGLGSGQPSLSDEMTLQGPFTHGRKWSCSTRWEDRKERKKCLNRQAGARWHFSRQGRGCGLLMSPTLDFMNAGWRAQGRDATELPYNLLSRFTDSI